MDYKRIGSIIQRDKNTGVWFATLIFQNEKERRTFYKYFAIENGRKAAGVWCDKHQVEFPRDADKIAQNFLY